MLERVGGREELVERGIENGRGKGGGGGQAQGTSRSPAPTHPHAPQTHACMYEDMITVLNKTETGRHA